MKEIIKKKKRIGMSMRRILSVVLAVVMVLTLIPLSCINVYASGTQGPANIPGSQDVDNCWILVSNKEETLFCPFDQIYYIESVDKRTFVYMKEACYETKYRLYEIEEMLPYNFFRCSKAMIININKLASVKAEFNARMRGVMINDEEVIISRNYVKELKGKLGL